MIRKGTRVGHPKVLNYGTVIEVTPGGTTARVCWDGHGRESREELSDLIVLKDQTQRWSGRTIQ